VWLNVRNEEKILFQWQNGAFRSWSCSFLDVPPMGSLQFSVGEVEQALLNLDANKGPGLEKIPPSTLKNCIALFSFSLCLIFNRSLTTFVFPEKWKLCCRKNCRTIYLQEHIWRPKRLNFSEPTWIHEGAFNSVESHEFTSFILRAIAKGLQVDSVYTDFSKAFDKVCYCLLLLKIAPSPLKPARCDLFQSYLSGRIQRIRIGNCVSSEIKVTSGVPQGSNLGPLWLCFILVHERPLSYFQIRSSSFLCRWREIVFPCKLFAGFFGNSELSEKVQNHVVL
jgi:Reverse transcriptase (RNA-dependent DNA polymerase)